MGQREFEKDRSVHVDFFDAASTVGATRKMGQAPWDSCRASCNRIIKMKKKKLEGPQVVLSWELKFHMLGASVYLQCMGKSEVKRLSDHFPPENDWFRMPLFLCEFMDARRACESPSVRLYAGNNSRGYRRLRHEISCWIMFWKVLYQPQFSFRCVTSNDFTWRHTYVASIPPS